ncbi:hypothetical protein FGE12_18285 [Aggregicoccus sp. 17bor-14]|uniref:hypothetical protein n=1 Tax=Myxococcaceae TaxID=31 RepID=UPI00129D08BC|nr:MULTISPECIES: hypothetical protein [Myxococcaceae]MBF5044353.1 hypothetical protein [Simulacricoccus sp. 17bor-14]MRI90100.1 hypothetical protein [Aggregicoccus sp. 17bor-14]
MLLELSQSEAQDLKQALDGALQALLEEIAHTDQRAFRKALRHRYDVLASVARRLELSLASSQVYA